MCGIFGVINFDSKPVDKQKVLTARDVIAHRGPDDAGIFISEEGNVSLAHRRLSILDLSPAGHQPMFSDDKRYVIVYNGEIYNYRFLRKEMEADGISFNSTTDTEVILKLFIKDGWKFLNKLRGMFAFAIWDNQLKRLYAARDRFGIKPFYFLHSNDQFIFSSELKAIKNYKKNLTVSIQALDSFLKTGSVPAPLTIYEETQSLLPGKYLETDLKGQTRSYPYWSFANLIKDFGAEEKKYDEAAKKAIKSTLLETVKLHCVSDVEVGAFLSGGIDSSAIVSLMRQSGQEKIKTISVTFPGNKLDESKYSNLAAKKYETDHFEYRLQEKELLDDFEKIIEAMDQPTIDGINTYFVSKAAASFGLKVVLSGLGGDELFGGYPSFINIPKYQRIKSLPLAKQTMKAAGLVLKGKLPAKAIEYFNDPDTPNAEYKLIRGLFTYEELKSLGWNQSSIHPISHPELVEGSLSPLQYVSMMESCVYMRNQLLRDSDVFSMAHSLELRVPFVDHLLYSAVLPYLDGGFDRKFPKKILVDGTQDLPDEIVHRPKQGFTFPFADWIRSGEIKNLINDSVSSSKMKEYFNQSALLNLQKGFEENKIHWSRIWAIWVLNSYL